MSISPWAMSEAELLAEILNLCKDRDLWPVRMAPERFAARVAANRGFPDLAIYGPRGVLYRELKTCKGQYRVSAAQTAWKYRLRCSGLNWDVWTPADLDSGYIAECLRWLKTPGPRTDAFALCMARDDK